MELRSTHYVGTEIAVQLRGASTPRTRLTSAITPPQFDPTTTLNAHHPAPAREFADRVWSRAAVSPSRLQSRPSDIRNRPDCSACRGSSCLRRVGISKEVCPLGNVAPCIAQFGQLSGPNLSFTLVRSQTLHPETRMNVGPAGFLRATIYAYYCLAPSAKSNGEGTEDAK